MPFPKRLLIEGEELVLDLRPHPIALLMPALVLLVGLIAASWLLTTDVSAWVPLIGLVVLILAYVGPKFLNWWTSQFAVTSERIIRRRGWISKYSMEIPLEAINDVRFEQGIFDRVVGAGTLLISSASEFGTNTFNNIRHPEDVQKTIYHQGEMNRKRMYQGSDRPPQVPQEEPVPPAPRPATGVPSTTTELERLAKLRDDGVLTEDEFQVQKAKILGQS